MFTKSRPNIRAMRALAFLCFISLSLSALPSVQSYYGTSILSSTRDTQRREEILPGAPADESAPAVTRAQESYGKLGLSFEANHGQTDEQVRFLARGSGYTLFLTATDAVFALRNSDCESRTEDHSPRSLKTNAQNSEANPQSAICTPQSTVLRTKIESANSAAIATGEEQLPGIVNYFIGNDPSKWHTDIPTFARVRYAETYPGIDLVYYGNQMQLEYDFVVRPGADSRQVLLSFEGADSVEIEATTGDLLLQVDEQTIRQHKPFVYQEVQGERNQVDSAYEIKGDGQVGFRIGAYDRARPLIIDPVLAYSTYLGGELPDIGSAIAVDSLGNTYVTGLTGSTLFPTTPGAFDTAANSTDIFVTKFDASGSALVYSTYLGGGGGDSGADIAIDSAKNAYVTGATSSDDFPTINPFQSDIAGSNDAFVISLNSSGSALLSSTYLGGSNDDSGKGVEVDSAGNAYVTGRTNSPNFPMANPIDSALDGTSNAFVTKLNTSSSTLAYSTYLGGSEDTDPEFSASGNGIAVDSAGNAYVTGLTGAPDFPTTAGALSFGGGTCIAPSVPVAVPCPDGFVTKISPSGSTLYSTFLGGNSLDVVYGIALDSAGNAYVVGVTASTNLATPDAFDTSLNGGVVDAFVTKLNTAGTAFAYSTYLGGNFEEFGYGIAVDSAGNAHVTGYTRSTDFPTTPDAFQTTDPDTKPIQGDDAFVTKLNTTGSALAYSTYLGGSIATTGAVDRGYGIAIDSAGNSYITGVTRSTNFPTTATAFQTTSGGFEAFVAKFGDYAISGRVIDSSGNGIAGVTVTLSGSNSDSKITDANGTFNFLNTTPGSNFTVTPFKTGFTFSPQSNTINNLNSNQQLLFIGTTTAVTPTPTPTPGAARVQFEFDQYIAAEDCGGLEIAVTRTGDISSSLTVDFATSDDTAKQKGDYTITLGTLAFAPGETSQTITLLITEDSFVEGDETFNLNLFNLSGAATLEEPSRTIVTIADDDPSGTTINPIDDTHTFVCQHYHDFLNREPDTSGLLFWINNIDSCGANGPCREAKRIDTSAAFFLSIEFQGTGFYAIRLQRAAFGKRSDSATTRMTYQDLVRDTRQLGEGVIVGQVGADAQLEQNKQNYAMQVVTSAAFISRFPSSQTAAEYVDALYASAQVSPSATERTDAITAFGGGGTSGRVAALRKVVESQSLVNAEFSPAFVLMEYHGYLRRNPTDLPDTNDSGYQFWLAKLNSFGGDFHKAEIVKAFLSSTEYRQRFGQS